MSRSTPAEGLTRDQVRSAYLAACRAELQALKPGNVHVFAAGHGMSIADFETSALASSYKPNRRLPRVCRRAARSRTGARMSSRLASQPNQFWIAF